MGDGVSETGPRGERGETGKQGAQGHQGVQGWQGEPGDAGRVGDQGEKGEVGGDLLKVTVDDPAAHRVARIGAALAVSLLMNTLTLAGVGYLAWTARAVAHDTNLVVRNIEDQTSPDAQAAQQLRIDSILKRFDCSNRTAIEDALNQLVEQGVLNEPIDITDVCPPTEENP